MTLKTNKVYLPNVVGKGYGSFWNYKGIYMVVKGSRASKKSTTIAMNLIYKIMAYPGSNALVVRKTYQLCRILDMLNLGGRLIGLVFRIV